MSFFTKLAEKMNDSSEPALRCSFCNKDEAHVKKLIAGPTVFICDECVAVCQTILADLAMTAATQGPALVPCVICQTSVSVGDGIVVPARGLICFGCLGEVEAAIAEARNP